MVVLAQEADLAFHRSFRYRICGGMRGGFGLTRFRNKRLLARLIAFQLVVFFLIGAFVTAPVAAASYRPVKQRMSPPVEPACVSSPFGPRIMPNRPLAGTFHNGIDIPAPIGSPVTAVAPGTVIRIQRHGIGGLEMLIQHDGFISVYSHLGLIAPMLAEGRKRIYGGEMIATVGRTGLTYGPHLYFGMIVDGRSVDPATYINIAPCTGTLGVKDARIGPTRLFAQH